MPATALEPCDASADRRRPRLKCAVFAVLALTATMALPPGTSGAATAVGLGTAGSFAVLGGETVTNTGPSIVDGDLGVSPGTAVTGFLVSDGGPGIVTGNIHAGDATALDAQSAATTAYGALSEQPCDVNLTDPELGGLTLTPGVYCFSSAAQLTGDLTLDGSGDPDAAFIFRIGTALTTASDSTVQFLGDLGPCRVFWQVGSAATLGTNTAFVGTVIAEREAITALTGATVLGRLLALTAAVNLQSNEITATACTTGIPPEGEPPPAEEPPPVVEVPVDPTPVDPTPVDETPVDETPVDEAPVDETPVDETPVDETPVDGPTDRPGQPLAGGPTVPQSAPAGPAVPVAAGPAIPAVTGGPTGPGLTGGPAGPGMTGGPAAPRAPLAATGFSTTMPAGLALLAIMIGCGLVTLSTHPRLLTTPPAPSTVG